MLKILQTKLQQISPTSLLLAIIIIFGLSLRLTMFAQAGKDTSTFLKTVNSFMMGENPYKLTLRSFEDSDVTSGGYAYFPGLLYTFYILYVLSFLLHVPYIILWKIPVLLADLGISILLVKILKDKGNGATVTALLVWLFNPYIITNLKYTYNDPIAIFFFLLSIYLMDKNQVHAGATYAIAVIFKTFPLFCAPVYLLFSKKNLKFIIAGLMVATVVSIPFLKTINDFLTYLQGSLFVHEGREVTGRPILFYISYYWHIEFIRLVPLKIYTLLAVFLGWLAVVFFYYVLKIKDIYILCTVVLSNFYLFTPVLNRTYLLWFLPVFLISSTRFSKNKYVFYAVIFIFYLFYSWYLLQWKDGFQTTIPSV
jgi:hypothetical protein